MLDSSELRTAAGGAPSSRSSAVGTQAALKVFEEGINDLKKQVEGLHKKVKALTPSPSAADLLNRIVGKKAIFAVRNGTQYDGTLLEHDRYNCLVETDDGQIVLLKHAIDTIKPTD
jgi:sRNA-binding regulator protein Hfq